MPSITPAPQACVGWDALATQPSWGGLAPGAPNWLALGSLPRSVVSSGARPAFSDESSLSPTRADSYEAPYRLSRAGSCAPASQCLGETVMANPLTWMRATRDRTVAWALRLWAPAQQTQVGRFATDTFLAARTVAQGFRGENLRLRAAALTYISMFSM